MNKINFKNFAHTVKEWAKRFFNVYFFISVALITLLIITDKNYIAPLIVCGLFQVLNSCLKLQLNKNNSIVNIGVKQGVCVIVLSVTYLILMLIGDKDILQAVALILSVFVLFEIYETNLLLVEWVNFFISKKEQCNKVENAQKKKFISKLVSFDNEWNKNEFDNDEISKMLFEFVNISNDNQMGHVVIRSMTSTDEDNVEKLFVKAKEGYHIIIRGTFENITKHCSDILQEGNLTEISEEIINKFNDKLNDIESEDKIFCAFKEVQDINNDQDNDFILAGCGVFEYEIMKETVKKTKMQISNDYTKIMVNAFSRLIVSVLVSANIFASFFDAVVYNVNSLFNIAILCFVFTMVLSYCGELKQYKTNFKYILFSLSLIGLCISYFIGRYVMMNYDCLNDLYYSVTANVMSMITITCYIILYLLTSIKYFSNKTKLVTVIACLLLVAYMFLPYCGKLTQGYCVSCVFSLVALLISVICVAIGKISNLILRDKNDEK